MLRKIAFAAFPAPQSSYNAALPCKAVHSLITTDNNEDLIDTVNLFKPSQFPSNHTYHPPVELLPSLPLISELKLIQLYSDNQILVLLSPVALYANPSNLPWVTTYCTSSILLTYPNHHILFPPTSVLMLNSVDEIH